MNNNKICNSTHCTCSDKYCAKKVSLFSTLSNEELDKILALITRSTYEKSELLFSEGEVFDKLFIINSGSIKIFKYTKEGKEQILYILKEGDFLGDLNLLKKDTFKFNAVALENTNLCIIHKDDFDNIIKTNPEISLKVLEYAHDRISTLEELIQTLTTKDIEVRLATLLIYFSKTFGIETPSGIEMNLPLTREDMASFIGITRETISRKLSNFQNEGIIDIIENKKILIKDYKKLREISEL